jgi:sortase B
MDEEAGKRVVKALNSAINYALVAFLCLPLLMGCYALWDSHVVYERAETVQWMPYKPTEPEPLSFWELQRINPEVRAWHSVYGTSIEYPVCQASQQTEAKYLTTDAKGDYSLSGALFMEVANAPDFSDFNTIVYGHHMQNEVMFGSITNFEDGEYFDAHRYGELFANDTYYGLEFFCYLDADAYDKTIYRLVSTNTAEREEYLSLLHQRARHWRDDVQASEAERILILSTCASGSTNGRAILIARMCGERFTNPFQKVPNLGTGVNERKGLLGIPAWCWLALMALVGLVVLIVHETRERRRAA